MTTQRMFDCLIAGDANVDVLVEGLTLLETDKEKAATDLNLVLGGSSSINAFNLSRLGARVTFIGVVGEDLFGRYVEAKLASANVDLSGLKRLAREKTGVTMWFSKGGKRAGVTYPGTMAMLSARDISDDRLRTARHLHVGSYFQLTRLHPQAAAVFKRAKKLGLTTSLDCNYDPSERWDSNLMAVLKHIDIFLPNEQEALRISRRKNIEAAARELAALAGVVVIKLGAKGALVCRNGEIFRVPALKVKRVVDTTGAGDSFNAGFLSRFLQGAELRECAEAGIKAGARCVQKLGGTAAFEA